MPGQARHGAGLHGHLCVRDEASCSELLQRDARRRRNPRHDFGKDLIPYVVKNGKRGGPPLRHLLRALGCMKPKLYWRDVGTVDAYWEANMLIWPRS